MFVKEISLEGFKSYATSTFVSNFDPCFNAITGLNGSGKSNILDSICFVLGITKLEQVRASNLNELVYKQGQAGVTKATVSVTFDNSDRSRSPIGFEDMSEITVTRQVVVGGRNKYLINGHVAQPSRVQNLFHSVQLNVNNPHFLIMQGRITKVLNMKPHEILSMLEEAAGTRMYETKRVAALKTLEKKQTKVNEIDQMLEQEILPALDKLKKEKCQYMQWAKANEDIERLDRFCTAYRYVEAEKIKNAGTSEIDALKSKIDGLQENINTIEAQIQDKEATIRELTSAKEKKTGQEMKGLADVVDKLSSSLVKETSAFTNEKDLLDAERVSAERLLKNMADLDCLVDQKVNAIQKGDTESSGIREKTNNLSKLLEELETEYQSVQAGKGGGGDQKSLAEQLADAKAAVGRASTELKQVSTKILHTENELKEKKKALESKTKEASSLQVELQSRKAEIDKILKTLEGVTYENGHMERLEESRKQELEMVENLKQEVSNLGSSLVGVEFSFEDPVNNFDRRRVKGVVARLIRVDDSTAVVALEVAAGSKLYNVVVDTEQTGKLLLEKGKLRRRVTIIPLNKIQASTIPSRVQDVAASMVGPENCRTALSLVGYDRELQAAMGFVFGGTFVCKTTDVAKQVAFHKDTRTASVTLDGDIFQPSGLLTGGSRKGGGELLKQLHALSEAESKLSTHRHKLAEVDAEIAKVSPIHKKYQQLKSQLDLKQYDFSLFEKRVEQSEHHKLSEAVAGLAAELDNWKKEAHKKEEYHKECLGTAENLEQAISEHGRGREGRLKALDTQIKSVKREVTSASKELKDHEGLKERLIMEKEAAVQEKQALHKQWTASESQIKKLEAGVEKLASKVRELEEEYRNAEEQLNHGRAKLKECDSQINALVTEQNQLRQSQTEANLEIKRTTNEIKRMETDQRNSADTLQKLRKDHKWIDTEKQFFGKPGTDYDFSSRDPKSAREELERKKAEQNNLGKRVNTKVMTMFEKAEQECSELLRKKGQVQDDKAKIEAVIRELDEKKKETLKVTWQHVNKDFGSIFSTLLPGSMAKLEPPEGCGFLDGLEVRVGFGGVWKQSLSELSGGQRSLIALSIILALLLYKPAPIYILDEVDAALDLSHTQNIGRMIKTHFPHSQFIVVSLKEGMFNNANVIFRTKFVDGVSTVTRTGKS
ncbi:hypothetical protein SELMODRAFT_137981 [Selaginella moellendorffii]|uniref:Structural maintenance of chromosomes protein n=1 Tax=Selaginella moellendorffii TaxID=88036 RepID=D8TEJ2_SELML|nr:structural maintenance of chromosomes protein 2-2 [Selaginella moellendorffii]EFJ04936.1 hypothetical protein SELMODRAFT_137981 [Selaginella moellendorffii]|eukprot:XP_002993996.1 structural maintenance of chromosomes protein 2-2 [Selaginella moellendorffii]